VTCGEEESRAREKNENVMMKIGEREENHLERDERGFSSQSGSLNDFPT
jgi:hypothetical protein